jgi:hypothetical protein
VIIPQILILSLLAFGDLLPEEGASVENRLYLSSQLQRSLHDL